MKLKPEEIKQTLESSFPPYRCEVGFGRYQHSIWLRVVDKNDKIIVSYEEISLTNFNISSLIELVKYQIRDENYPII